MKVLKIINVRDNTMWYAQYVGLYVPFVSKSTDCFLSRELNGYINVVRLNDAEIVEVEGDVSFY